MPYQYIFDLDDLYIYTHKHLKLKIAIKVNNYNKLICIFCKYNKLIPMIIEKLIGVCGAQSKHGSSKIVRTG